MEVSALLCFNPDVISSFPSMHLYLKDNAKTASLRIYVHKRLV